LVAGFDSYRFYSTLLVLSETVLVLVIESNLYGCYVRSTQDLTLNATKLVLVSEYEYEYEDERGYEDEDEDEDEDEHEHEHGYG
jgi:hypothetical protein